MSSFLVQLTPSPPLPVSLSLEDSELLSFYSSQSLAHLSCLADAIDVLFSSVQGNQPPRIFVARGKSLIVTAHKLVFIGDTLSRLLTSADLRAKVCRGKPFFVLIFFITSCLKSCSNCVVFMLCPSDHNLRGTTLPSLEISCRSNKGCCSKLPVSICHPGDGGPRG